MQIVTEAEMFSIRERLEANTGERISIARYKLPGGDIVAQLVGPRGANTVVIVADQSSSE